MGRILSISKSINYALKICVYLLKYLKFTAIFAYLTIFKLILERIFFTILSAIKSQPWR